MPELDLDRLEWRTRAQAAEEALAAEHRLRVEAEGAWGRWQRRAEKAEADALNNSQDYDRRGERLWRLAAKAGWTPGNDADNDAIAESCVSDALAERDGLAARLTAVKALAARLDGFAESTISVPDSELYSTLAAEIRKAVEVDHG